MDRNGEFVDLGLLKITILSFVQLGFKNVDQQKQDNDYVWKGDKTLDIYNEHFEKFFINKSK